MNNNLRFSAVVALLATGGALAQEPEPPQPIQFGLTYTADYIGVIDGGLEQRGDYLDNLDVLIDADLDALMGWSGGTLHLHVLNNAGGTPNDFAGTLQGIDNIEVGEQRLRLFEAWIEQALGESATLRLGLYDLNSEFYANDAAGLLIASSFGIGSELAATGLNGPSVFPSTACRRGSTSLSARTASSASPS
jgi:porin